jgi:hypothetical protein
MDNAEKSQNNNQITELPLYISFKFRWYSHSHTD